MSSPNASRDAKLLNVQGGVLIEGARAGAVAVGRARSARSRARTGLYGKVSGEVGVMAAHSAPVQRTPLGPTFDSINSELAQEDQIC